MTDTIRPVVALDQHNNVATITMTHEPYNLLGPALLDPLLDMLEKSVADGARAVVIRSGLRHFSAGADIALFSGRATRVGSDGGAERTDSGTLAVLNRIAGVPAPVIASVHGVCLGGGLELALASDYVISARSAKLGCVEATLGLHPLMGGVQRIAQRAGEARAKEMAMLGRRYDAATLERWNVINLVVDDDSLTAATESVAAELAAGPTVAHTATKQLARLAIDEGVAAADRGMTEIQRPIWLSADLQTGLASFQESGAGLAKFEGR